MSRQASIDRHGMDGIRNQPVPRQVRMDPVLTQKIRITPVSEKNTADIEQGHLQRVRDAAHSDAVRFLPVINKARRTAEPF